MSSLGEVCGKCIAAAVKWDKRINAPTPLAVLDQANKVILLNDHDAQFTTAIYGIFGVASRTVTYACGGHHLPILVKVNETPRVMLNHGFALGVELNLPDRIPEHAFDYESGSLLVLYTDGIIESSHNVEEGETKLLQAVQDAVDTKARHPARFIVDSVLRREEPQRPDDIAVLTIFLSVG